MDIKYPEVKVELSEQDGNAFAIMARVHRALKSQLRDIKTREEIDKIYEEYTKEAMSGDYDNLLGTTMEWFDCN